MAHKKAGGSTRNGRDSEAKRLGVKESAYGIGCTTWEVIWRIVLPFTKNGVIGGIMLGLGRALGETMAVTFIIGNTYQLCVTRNQQRRA